MNANSLNEAKLPLARIPWIPTKMSENTRLQDSKFFKTYLSQACGGRTFDNIVLYRFLDEVFPYYLPKRYHTMDVVALEEMSSSTNIAEDYTSCNATFFLLRSCMYSNGLRWIAERHMNYAERADEELINPKLKAALFQKGVPPEQCDSAAEFIMEPWVLSQLLFQPAILHQWVMAVYAEGLQLHAEIAALVHFPATPKLSITKSVRYILKMLDLLDTCVMRGLKVLQNWTVSTFRQSDSRGFFDMVLDLLPFFKLVASKKVIHILRAAKRLLFNSSVKYPGGNVMEPYVASYKYYNIVYSFKYWQKEDFDYMFVGNSPYEYEAPPMPGSRESHPDYQAWAEKIRIKFGSLAKWDKIKNFVDQKILQPGWIQGVKAEDVLKLVEGDMMILYHYLIYIKYEGMSSSAPGIREADTGILQVIRTLQADNELAYAHAAMTVRVFMIVMVKNHPIDVRLQAVNCEGPDIAVKEMMSAVSLMKTKSSFSNLMKQLEDQVPATSEKAADEEQQCPSMDTMEVLDIVASLEIRIKKIMLGIVKTFFESYTANDTKVCYEAAFIQYVLPTFVVSFLRSTKNPEATLEDQKRHLSFVHHLIKTFEDPNGLITPLYIYFPFLIATAKSTTYEFMFRTMADMKGHRFSLDYGLVSFKHAEIRHELLQPYDGTGRVPPILMKSFLHFNAGLLDILKDNSGSDSIADSDEVYGTQITSPVCQTWTSWISRYLTRIQYSLQKAHHGTETTPVNHRLSQCLNFCDILFNCSFPGQWEENNPLYLLNSLLLRVIDFVHEGNETYILSPKEYRSYLSNVWKAETGSDARKLSGQQVCAIAFYHLIKRTGLRTLDLTEKDKSYLMPAFHLDKFENALNSIMLNDTWRLKQVISEWLNDADGKNDISLATFKDVKAAPRCYKLAKKDLIKDGRVKMSYPGEITFFPIKHCRWCGLVDNGKIKMQLCKECQKTPKYPDKCFFCSQKCEDKAMENLHTEEHVRFLMVKLEMID